MTIGQEITEILKTEIWQDAHLKIELDTDLLTSGALNSMALIRFVSLIEAKYEIKIPPTDLVIENFLNIDSIQSYLVNRLKL